jgi:hypothetical protein
VIAAVIVLLRMRAYPAGTGLVAAYVANFAMNHWVGAAIYLIPDYSRQDPNVVALGFQQATVGLAAFGVGSALLAPRLVGLLPRAPRHAELAPPGAQPAVRIICYALLSFLVFLPLARKVPTLTSLFGEGLSLLVLGLGLACWNAWQTRRTRAFAFWLLATLALPLVTIVTQGFLGYGSVAALAILTFVATFVRPRWVTALTAIAMCYLGLSLFVTYMRDRPELRAAQATQSVPDRIDRTYQTVTQTLTTFEFFDLSNQQHLDRVDDRLNQNLLVGRSITYLDQGLTPFAQFETVWNALLAFIPRAIWPTKPLAAGSPQLVSRFTGLTFAPGTSVGIGNVMEFYISFGTIGVVAGFLLLGILIALIDTGAGMRLRAGNWRGFLLWYLPALTFQQMNGSLVEITSTAGAALVVAFVLTRVMRLPRPRLASRPRPASRPASSAA